MTAGVIEARAWTIKKGWLAPQAAGTIHTDFEKKFIKADIVKYEDFVKCGRLGKSPRVRISTNNGERLCYSGRRSGRIQDWFLVSHFTYITQNLIDENNAKTNPGKPSIKPLWRKYIIKK